MWRWRRNCHWISRAHNCTFIWKRFICVDSEHLTYMRHNWIPPHAELLRPIYFVTAERDTWLSMTILRHHQTYETASEAAVEWQWDTNSTWRAHCSGCAQNPYARSGAWANPPIRVPLYYFGASTTQEEAELFWSLSQHKLKSQRG